VLSEDDDKSCTCVLQFTISFDPQYRASVKTVGKAKVEVSE